MEKTVLLKTQLHEAAKLGKSKEFKYQRLSVIFLDNFIEIQLRYLMDGQLHFDKSYGFREKKYKQKQRIKIVTYYDELLKACVKEDIINKDEQILLLFCHDVRNNLYHKINEEELLVKVSIKILHKIISKRQPSWRNAYGATMLMGKDFDPFVDKKRKNSALFDSNTEKEWKYFLKKYFDFLDKREKSIQQLLSKNIKSKIKDIKSNIKFVDEEFIILFPHAKDWKFNEFCLFYSFKNNNKDKIEAIKEDKENGEIRYKELFNTYKKNWKKIDKNILKKINKDANNILKLSIIKSIEKYISIRTEMNMIYNTFGEASYELDCEIQRGIDILRGK